MEKITLTLRFRQYISEGLKDDEINIKIKEEFPSFGEKKTHYRYCSYYRSVMKKEQKFSELLQKVG